MDLTTARITKVTESGKATNGAMSPDGRYVAYVENEGDEYSLWVKQIATDGKTQVVPRQPLDAGASELQPGRRVRLFHAAAMPRRGGFVLSRVPTIGGLETPILDDVDTPVSFSPDGREFVFMRGADRVPHIVVADAGGGSQRILATRKAPLAFAFFAPDWSPDGKVVAASANDQSKGWRSSIVLLPVDGGDSRELYATDSRHRPCPLAAGRIWAADRRVGRAERQLRHGSPAHSSISREGRSGASRIQAVEPND